MPTSFARDLLKASAGAHVSHRGGYYHDVLIVALERYPALVSKWVGNQDTEVLVRSWSPSATEPEPRYGWMGRRGGLGVDELADDIAMGSPQVRGVGLVTAGQVRIVGRLQQVHAPSSPAAPSPSLGTARISWLGEAAICGVTAVVLGGDVFVEGYPRPRGHLGALGTLRAPGAPRAHVSCAHRLLLPTRGLGPRHRAVPKTATRSPTS